MTSCSMTAPLSPVAPPLETSRFWHWSAILLAALFPTLGTWVYFIALSGHAWMSSAYAVAKCLQFAFPLVWVLAVQRARPGWPWRGTAGIGLGLAFGAMVATAMCGAYLFLLQDTALLQSVADAVRAKMADAGIDTRARFLSLALFYCLVHSLAEEYYWRWFVYAQLRRVSRESMANIVSSLAFMAHHVLVVWSYMRDDLWAVAVFSLAVAVGGSFWAWLYQRSQSLLGPWLSHLLVDAAIMAIGYWMIWGA